MTREEKIAWLRAADTDVLLRQYEASVRRADKAWAIVEHDKRYTLEEIFEDLEIAKAEVMRRMTK